ncbi:hypothetical protein AURDEDRAFT_112040 [Auricularia subglabra TFB-10046 SS5]|nr:hypothetical protein AURDEDRAFT_112040 [Auricularia subglabra TFB-10046 SS5]
MDPSIDWVRIVNLAPTEPVELYIVVEELEERLLDNMGTVLQHVRASLAEPANGAGAPPPLEPAPREPTAAEVRALAMEIDGGAEHDEEMWAEDDDADEYVPEGALESDLGAERIEPGLKLVQQYVCSDIPAIMCAYYLQ